MGITVAIIKQRPYYRYQQRHRYWHKSGTTEMEVIMVDMGVIEVNGAYREQRGYNRKSRYRRDSSRSYRGSK